MRYVRVALDLGGALGDSLTYLGPVEPCVQPGSFVRVSVRERTQVGIVLGPADEPEFEVRPITAVLPAVSLWSVHLRLAEWLSAYYRAPLFECLRLCMPPGLERRLRAENAPGAVWPPRGESGDSVQADAAGAMLSRDQAEARDAILSAFRAGRSDVFLLHGVTGSGKTHVYLEAAVEVLGRDRQVIILVSDISLTPEALARIEARFPGRCAVLHSGLSEGTRARTWRALHEGDLSVVVGPRSALFAPARRLGLIVMDEEHEPSYKQDQTPRYHARDAAVQLGKLVGAPVVLSSATPDVTSYYAAEQGRFQLLTLPRRVVTGALGRTRTADLPPVEVVDLRAELKAGHAGVLSRALERNLGEVLQRDEQAMLFLNRRGAATAVACRACGNVMQCRRCSAPLGYHSGQDELICHHCGRRRAVPPQCLDCGADQLAPLGVGVQRVEAEVRRIFPAARVMRWDSDVTGRRGAHEQLWRSFAAHEFDVLVGTQMIGKGLDFPDVSLVGIVLADHGLHRPDFRAAERSFQILTQVAGRAGRRDRSSGRVILQTYVPDHYVIRAAERHDYLDLYRREIAFRRQQAYPPFRPLVRLVHSASNAERGWSEVVRLATRIRARADELGYTDLQLLGPAPAALTRLRGRYRWHLVLAGADARRALDEVRPGPGWIVDVDPMEMV